MDTLRLFAGASNLVELNRVLRASVMVRRLKRDVLPQLPAKRRQQVGVVSLFFLFLVTELCRMKYGGLAKSAGKASPACARSPGAQKGLSLVCCFQPGIPIELCPQSAAQHVLHTIQPGWRG